MLPALAAIGSAVGPAVGAWALSKVPWVMDNVVTPAAQSAYNFVAPVAQSAYHAVSDWWNGNGAQVPPEKQRPLTYL